MQQSSGRRRLRVRFESDGAERAVQIAKQVDGPVKVGLDAQKKTSSMICTGQMFFDRLSAGLDASGKTLPPGAIVLPVRR